MKTKVANFFFFNRAQQLSLIILAVITISYVAYSKYSKSVSKTVESNSFEVATTIVELIEKEKVVKKKMEPYNKSKEKTNIKVSKSSLSTRPNKEVIKTKHTLVDFDPNRVNIEKLISLGFTNKVANTLIKFRNSGAKFYQPDDLKKIYGMTDDFYSVLLPFIKIKEKKKQLARSATFEKVNSTKTNVIEEEVLRIEVNSATADDFKKLHGIGPTYSERIVKFRNLLGGYQSIMQINEVYGLPDSTFQQIKSSLIININKVSKLDLMNASVEDLSKHVYITWKQAKTIKNYVYQHLDIEDTKELYNIKNIAREDLDRIIPYLKITKDTAIKVK